MKTKTTDKTSVSAHPTIAELAAALEVSPRRISQLRLESMPVDSIEAALAWRQKQRDAKNTDSTERLKLARIRLVDSQRAKIELDAAVRRGELIERGVCLASATHVCSTARAALWKLQSDLPPRLDGLTPAAMGKVLREAITEILTELSNGFAADGFGESDK